MLRGQGGTTGNDHSPILKEYWKKENAKAGKKKSRGKSQATGRPFPMTRKKWQWLSFLHTADPSELQVISPSCQGAQPQSFSSALGILEFQLAGTLQRELADSRVMRKAILPSYPGSGLKWNDFSFLVVHAVPGTCHNSPVPPFLCTSVHPAEREWNIIMNRRHWNQS